MFVLALVFVFTFVDSVDETREEKLNPEQCTCREVLERARAGRNDAARLGNNRTNNVERDARVREGPRVAYRLPGFVSLWDTIRSGDNGVASGGSMTEAKGRT